MRGKIDLDGHKFGTLFRKSHPKATWKKRARMPKMPGGMQGQYFMLWRIVDGAVRDTFIRHPDYLTDKGRWNARISLNKRITGALMGYATQVARCRSVKTTVVAVGNAAADSVEQAATSVSAATAVHSPLSWVRYIKAPHLWRWLKNHRPKFNGGSNDA